MHASTTIQYLSGIYLHTIYATHTSVILYYLPLINPAGIRKVLTSFGVDPTKRYLPVVATFGAGASR